MENKYDLTLYGNVYVNVSYDVIEYHVRESYPNFDHIMIFDLSTYKYVNPNNVYDNYLHKTYVWRLNWFRRTMCAGTGTGKVRCTKSVSGFSYRGKGLFSDMAFSRTRESTKEYMEPRIRKVHIPGYYDWYDGNGLCNRSRSWKRTKVRKQFMKHTKHNKVSLPSRLDWDTDE